MKQNYSFLILCINLMISFPLMGQTIIRGPYLQKGTPTSIVVKWRTDSNTSSTLEYGSDGSYSSVLSDSTPKTDHEIEITGLTPDTKYYYRIGHSGSLLSGNTEIYFKTHPVVGNSGFYRFWILGNTGLSGIDARQDAEAVKEAYYNHIGPNETNGILLLGDNAYNFGTDIEYQEKVFDVYDAKLRNSMLWSCVGNHDGYSANAQSQTGPYYDIFTFPKSGESGGLGSGTESYYSFDYGNIHFISLNSFDEDRSVGGPMYNWVLNDIQNTDQEWIVAFWHHPPYSKGWYDSDTTTNREGEESGSYLIEMRENFIPMLEQNGVDLVLSAHTLVYERSYFLNGHYGFSNTFDLSSHTIGDTGDGDGKINGDGAYRKTSIGSDAGKGTVYVVNSTASQKVYMNSSISHNAMHYSASKFGSSILEADANILTFKFLSEFGNIDDQFTIEKTRTWYQDLDSDSFGNPTVTLEAVSQPTGYVADNTDCIDSDSSVNPEATEVPYNGIDDDCDPLTLDDDLDQDGYNNVNDCDDTNENINPGVTEIAGNGIDDDCNPTTSDGSEVIDADGDGYPAGSLFSDGFNRADSSDLGPDWTHSTGLGGGVASIVSNAVENNGGTFAVAFRNGVFGADHWSEATFSGGGVSWSGVALRCDATSSVVWQCSGSVIQMIVMDNGSISTKGQVNYTVVEGDIIRGEVSGTTYKVYINDNLVHTVVNPSEANNSGNPGIMVEGYAMDDWSGGDTFGSAVDCDDTDSAVNPGVTEVPYNGIDDDCDPLTLDDDSGNVLGLENLDNNENSIKVYPNPFNDNITIKLPLRFNDIEFNLKVFDISGRLVLYEKYTSSNGMIHVPEMNKLDQTSYLLEITSPIAGNRITKLLFKY